MGNKCCTRKKNKKKLVLLLLGLDNAGKTVAARGLAGEPLETVVPTIGFSVIPLSFRDYKVKVFDLGGGQDIRGIWPQYFIDAHGIIFVVDSSDASRLDEVKSVLNSVLSHEKVSGKPVVILANKQDKENALDEIDLVEKLDLENMVNNNQCPTLVESCSATETSSKSKLDPGIRRGYYWLLNFVHRHYENLNHRVEIDVRHQELLEKQYRQETMEKLKRLQSNIKTQDDVDAIESYSDYNRKLNGKPKSFEDTANIQNHALVIQASFTSSSQLSSNKSTESFPPVYYGTTDNEFTTTDRPKSSTRIVTNQLKLEQTQLGLPFRTFRPNRTHPVNFMGLKMPHSAKERRSQIAVMRKALKSAGDSVFVTSELPNVSVEGPDGDLGRELYALKRLKRREGKSDENGLPWTRKGSDVCDKVSVIELE